MQTLELDERHKRAKTPGFFERQFSLLATRKQQRFDWAFGVILPTVCIAADPIVFRSSIGLIPNGEFSKYAFFVYALSSVSTIALAAWLLWGDRLGELRPYLGGLFLAASAVSTLIGLAIFPISLITSIVLIGMLGFTPLFCGFVFLRNAIRVFDSATEDLAKRYVLRAAFLAAIYALVVPFVLSS